LKIEKGEISRNKTLELKKMEQETGTRTK